ncbi:hypothetical protein QGN29_02520 [Temperatibacter marinus]|uniref:Flagellar protein FliL n=1 Tax=Temperatibacter marinus TaxID=1456591 RepID=A0AA52ED40_9PROT|nr:hypothetical protein [Temperatibacter marinus]WND03242.1 hypothetical protein QGN29_02520 [Temperatibacter marinus]
MIKKITLLTLMSFLFIQLLPAQGLAAVYSVKAQDGEEGEDKEGQIDFNPIIYTSIRNGRPYLQITLKAVGKIQKTPTQRYHDRKDQLAASMLTIISRLAKKKFRVGRRLDPDLIRKYLQAAADRTLKEENAVKIFITQISQKPL